MVKRVRGSRTGRPIMVLLDLLGRRWALRIVAQLGSTLVLVAAPVRKPVLCGRGP